MKRSVLVTGGSGGLGSAVCSALAARGWMPIVAYVSSRRRAEAVAASTGGQAMRLDLASEQSIMDAMMMLADIDVAVAGVVLAASPPPATVPFGQINTGDLQGQWQVNVAGHALLVRELINRFLRVRRQGIVGGILSSAMGLPGETKSTARMGAYVIAKHGQLGLLKALQAEYAWLKVRWVAPGYIDTPMLRAFDERFIELVRAQQLISSPEQIAADLVGQFDD